MSFDKNVYEIKSDIFILSENNLQDIEINYATIIINYTDKSYYCRKVSRGGGV